MEYEHLRKKHPRFFYKAFNWGIAGSSLKIVFDFFIEPDIHFKPEIAVKGINKSLVAKIGDSALNNLIFNLGLIEIPSYWKTTCSPEIIIKAGFLTKEQIQWWKELIIKGMGQFFYENKIDWRAANFIKIKSTAKKSLRFRFDGQLQNRYLVPVGGGKDSIVTLEKLKRRVKKIGCFSVNPRGPAKNIVKVSGIKDLVIIERKIDPMLLKLNRKGYLNGHTPITAVLSFLSVLCAVLFDYKYTAFSNEKSADEGNVRYLGTIINHQWSKSSEFEKKFRDYCKKYLAKNVRYFSFLRRYTELEISKMFAKYPKYFSVFSSCNVAAARNLKKRWCGRCPKCLFVYAILYPFLKKKQILEIFGEDMFENRKLLPVMKSLIGQGRYKPFECVGTLKENKKAFVLSLEKAQNAGKIPYLLTMIG